MKRGSFAAAAVTVGWCIASLTAAFLPWLKSGTVGRSAFVLARSADALGFIDSPLRRAFVVSWYLLPLLTAAAWTAAALHRPGAVAAIGVVMGSMSVVAGSMFIALARPGIGPVAAVVTGAGSLASAAWLILSMTSTRSVARSAPAEGSSG